MKNARARWESQSPFIQRAVPPLVIAALVILVMLPRPGPRPSGARPARDRVRPLPHAPDAGAGGRCPATDPRASRSRTRSSSSRRTTSGSCSRCRSSTASRASTRWSVMAIFAMMAVGPEHGRRLRGPPRPRLRRVLRARRLHGGLARLAARIAVRSRREADRLQLRRHRCDRRDSAGSTSRSGSSSSPLRSSRPWAGSSSACRRCGCVATTSRSSRSGSGRSSPRSRATATAETLGFNLTNGPPGINPIDPPGFGVWLVRPSRPAGELHRRSTAST